MPLGYQRITQENEDTTATRLESPFSDSALPCQLQLTETETETERKCPSVNAMGEQNWPALRVSNDGRPCDLVVIPQQ